MEAAVFRKAIVAAIGVAALVLPDVFGADLEPALENAVDAAIGLLTVFGVFKVRNEPQLPKAEPLDPSLL